MTDVRALMAQERQARRINHEYAIYTKSGVLTCTACELNIRSETLWDGHLKSANHRTNVKKLHQASKNVAKRKIDDVDEAETQEAGDSRKKLKPKSRTVSEVANTAVQHEHSSEVQETQRVSGGENIRPQPREEPAKSEPAFRPHTTPVQESRDEAPRAPAAEIDENEWAAFERDVVSLAQPDYSAATITAAPVSAAQLEAEADSDRRRLRDTEADNEKEVEGRRMQEEFDVMEEMEERVRSLKEKREALRSLGRADVDTGQVQQVVEDDAISIAQDEPQDVSDDSEEDLDDWYS